MLNEVAVDICKKLDKAKIDYMLSGSLAMGIYTMGRSSWDIDVVISMKEEDIPEFISIFKERYFLQPDTIKKEIGREGMFNIIDQNTSMKIDFIIKKKSTFRDEEFNRRKRVNFFGYNMSIVSLEDLIISKLIWIQQLKSDMQLRDIAMLLLNENVDKEYLNKWINQLKLNTYGIL